MTPPRLPGRGFKGRTVPRAPDRGLSCWGLWIRARCPPSRVLPAGLIAEQFLEATAAQLTYHGLCELTAAAKEGELSVFFRNNHFSTMTKHKVKRARDWGIGEQSASGLCSPGQGLTQAEEDVAMVAKDSSVPWGWLHGGIFLTRCRPAVDWPRFCPTPSLRRDSS